MECYILLEKCQKHTTKIHFVMVLLGGKKLIVYNSILMESIGISVMVSIGLLLFFFSRDVTFD